MMVCGLLLYFSIASTFFTARSMNEPFWYMTLYFIASYIRMYPSKWSESERLATIIFFTSIVLAMASVVAIVACKANIKMFGLPPSLELKVINNVSAYYFVSDSNKFLALVVGTSAFLMAKNAPKFHNRLINLLSAGTFAVLLIHTQNDTMVHWLWQDLLCIQSYINLPAWVLALRLSLIPVVLFLISSLIDIPRRYWVETPMMRWLNSK